MKTHSNSLIAIAVLLMMMISCSTGEIYEEDFNSYNERNWICPDIWTIPLENWKVAEGRLECTGSLKNMRAVVLTKTLANEGDFLISLRMGILNKGEGVGSGGLLIGLTDQTDMDIRSLAYFGTGLNAGVNTNGEMFLGEISEPLPEGFDMTDFVLHLDGYHVNEFVSIRMQATDRNGLTTNKIEKEDLTSLKGAVAVVNNHPGARDYSGNNRFWFDDLSISGSSIVSDEENRFGPILWSMYTLSKGILKMSVQMPPLGKDDNKEVELYLQNEDNWEPAGKEAIEEDSRTAIFSVENWDNTIDRAYRIVYRESGRTGRETEFTREGVIRAEPEGRPLVMGGLTCQYHYGFPYNPLVKNLASFDPDILYFSGDQIYEGNGGYPIIRFPADSAILSYLGKWYMFGWAFGDLMRDRPTITIPDDHDIFQGNLWGDGGKNIPMDTFRQYSGTSGGYVEPAEMVNAVHRTQSGHLPDCHDKSLMEQGIKPYHTELVYGKVSFAITGDRMFKSGPKQVAFWEGRKDHITEPLKNLKRIDPPGLTLLGDMQLEFLREWAGNWEGANMKCLLSQTIFTNIATHHGGNKMVLHADLDSGGWPITPRNKVIDILRSCFAFHIAGDQHLPTLSHYGIDEFNDAGWAFCTPAIAVGYERRFLPEQLGLEINEKPDPGRPNTGKYIDPFGHPTYVYAVGNPEEQTADANRYERARKRSSGFGIIRFDTDNRTITTEAYTFLADLSDPGRPGNQFPGWPLTLDQLDNNGRKRMGVLEEIELNPEVEFLQVISEKTGKLEYSIRPAATKFTPWAYSKGPFTIKIINVENGNIKELKNLVPEQ